MSDVTSTRDMKGWGRARKEHPAGMRFRCSGCEFGHDKCERQTEAERFIHRLVATARLHDQDGDMWRRIYDEYEEKWA